MQVDSAARDCGGDPTQRLAEGEQAARGAAEPTRENLARFTVGSSPDAGSAAPKRGPYWHVRKEDLHGFSAMAANPPFASFDVVLRRDYDELAEQLASLTEEYRGLRIDHEECIRARA